MKDEFASIKAIFDNAPIGMALTRKTGEVVNMNARCISMLGYSSLNDVKQHIKNLSTDLYVKPEQRNKILTVFRKSESDEPFFVDFKRKDNSILHARLFIKPYKSENSNNEYLISTVEDFSYQKKLEKNIASIKKQYKQLFDSSTEAVFIHQNEVFIDYNARAKELLGLKEEHKQYMFTDISPKYQPDGQKSKDKGFEKIHKALKGEAQKFEWEFIDANGKQLFAEVALSKIEDGLFGNLLAIFRDITERKKAEEKLKANEAMLSSIIDCLPFELFVTNLNSDLLFQNRFSKRIWGDYTGKNITEGPASENGKKKWNENLERIKTNETLNYEDELQFKGKKYHAHKIVAPLVVGNETKGVISLTIDISDKVELEKQIYQNASFLNSILSSIPIELWVIDSMDNIHLQSDFSINKWGDLRGKKTTDFNAPVKFSVDINSMVKQVKKGKIVDTEYEVEYYGQKKYSRRILSPILDQHNKYGYTSISFDITELKNTLKELQYHKENLEQLVDKRSLDLKAATEKWKTTSEDLAKKKRIIEEKNTELSTTLNRLKEAQSQLLQAEKMASLGTLTSGVSHEINNPLNYLAGTYYGFESYFNKYGSKDEATTSLLMSSTKTAIERITAIVKGLNQFSRDNQKLDEECNIHSIIDNCLAILRNLTKSRVEIELKYCKDEILVLGNVGKIHQVFMNVITNSIQAIVNSGKILISTKIIENIAIIEISDSGCGISKENISKITDPFFTTKDPGKGTGLGLSITYSILQEHQGSINFDSEINKGTIARITLPIK